MAENKTKATGANVADFIGAIEHDVRRADAELIVEMMEETVGEAPKMWGRNIVGFGNYHYKYDSGREGDAPLVGFSPRKNKLVLYILPGFGDYADLMGKLGRHKTGKSCLYINKLADVDTDVLRELVELSVQLMKEKYPS